jgi:hypothetical protein
MPRLELFPFKFRHPVTGRWVRARYVAERHIIEQNYAALEITGPPEIRDIDPHADYFSPFRRPPRSPRFRYPLYEES